MRQATKAIWQGVHTGRVYPGETQVQHNSNQQRQQKRAKNKSKVNHTGEDKTFKIKQEVYKVTNSIASHILKNKSVNSCWHFVRFVDFCQ